MSPSDMPDMKLEVVVIPVSDVDRAKRFYGGLGWRLDADFVVGDSFRVVQFTPPGSPCSVHFGTGVTSAAPGSARGFFLAVSDILATHAALVARGVKVSEVFHRGVGEPPKSGVHPERASYSSYATFSDPDGNEWLLQEVTERLPGRVAEPDVAALAGLLLETAMHHDAFEKAAPEHNWWDWYAPYLSAREHGSTPEQATAAADLYMKEAHGVVASR
jgi:catechol 2,3-dioxygenase-like lactoylglutathione lyase family enzyme